MVLAGNRQHPFQANDAVNFIALGGKHDDGLMRLAGAQAAADRKPVLARQHQIENDQIESVAGERFVHRLCVLRRFDDKSLFAEVALQEVSQSFVVVDDKNFSFSHVRIVTGKSCLREGQPKHQKYGMTFHARWTEKTSWPAGSFLRQSPGE